jgi:hypothetical protein
MVASMSNDPELPLQAPRIPSSDEEMARLLKRALKAVERGEATFVCGAARPKLPRAVSGER